MNRRDDEFSKRLTATLDASVDSLDGDTRARLAAARQAALTRGRNKRVAMGLALAAGLAALIIAPNVLRENGPALQRNVAENRAVAEDMAYLSVDPQMLDDMDMLQAMDELQGDDGAPTANKTRGES